MQTSYQCLNTDIRHTILISSVFWDSNIGTNHFNTVGTTLLIPPAVKKQTHFLTLSLCLCASYNWHNKNYYSLNVVNRLVFENEKMCVVSELLV